MAKKDRALFPVVVHVVLLRGREIFLLRRANTGFMDGYFGLPGGHQEYGEGVAAAALRECEEEACVAPSALEPLVVFPYDSKGHQGLNFVFLADRWRGEPGIGEPEHADSAGFHSLAELPTPIAPWLRNVVALLDGDRRFHFEELRWD